MSRRFRRQIVILALLVLWIHPIRWIDASEAEKTERLPKAIEYWQKGYIYHMLGRYHLAVRQYRESIALQPTAEGHTFLGWSLSALGKYEEAIAECKKAIPLDPEFGNPYNDIGVYLMALHRADEAIPFLKKAMRAKRYCCYQFPYFNLGQVFMLKGKEKEARKLFKKALEIDPSYEPARQALQLLRKKGGWDL